MAWYWPEVHTLDKAKKAARAGACLCFCLAMFDALIVIRAVYKAPLGTETSFINVLHFNVSLSVPLFGCVLFAVAGWRIWTFSKAWVLIVFAWYLLSIRFLGPVLLLLFPPSFLLGFVLITAVRGAFAYHWLSEAQGEAGRAVGVTQPR